MVFPTWTVEMSIQSHELLVQCLQRNSGSTTVSPCVVTILALVPLLLDKRNCIKQTVSESMISHACVTAALLVRRQQSSAIGAASQPANQSSRIRSNSFKEVNHNHALTDSISCCHWLPINQPSLAVALTGTGTFDRGVQSPDPLWPANHCVRFC
jgi:hypothetical protein